MRLPSVWSEWDPKGMMRLSCVTVQAWRHNVNGMKNYRVRVPKQHTFFL